jgi:hypothetical protein
MRKWIDATIAGLAMWVASTTVMPADEIGYQAVDLANRETVSGKMLVIVAYAVIFGFLLLYARSIVHREKKVQKSIEELRRSIGAKK